MKLTTITQVAVDGVMQGNGGASDEGRRNGLGSDERRRRPSHRERSRRCLS
jgi:hypothetical protein